MREKKNYACRGSIMEGRKLKRLQENRGGKRVCVYRNSTEIDRDREI